MGWRFRKSFKLLPGIRLNVGKKGPTSVSVGRGGWLSTSIGKEGVRNTLSAPGTGVSFATSAGTGIGGCGVLGIIGVVLGGLFCLVLIVFAAFNRLVYGPQPAAPLKTNVVTSSPTPMPSPSPRKANKGSKRENSAAPMTAAPLMGNPNPTTRSAPSSRYIRGPRGGCYYFNGSGNKTYVDRSLCN